MSQALIGHAYVHDNIMRVVFQVTTKFVYFLIYEDHMTCFDGEIVDWVFCGSEKVELADWVLIDDVSQETDILTIYTGR
jgi:hypothetical protein